MLILSMEDELELMELVENENPEELTELSAKGKKIESITDLPGVGPSTAKK